MNNVQFDFFNTYTSHSENCLLRNTTISGEGPCLSWDLTVARLTSHHSSLHHPVMERGTKRIQPWVADIFNVQNKTKCIIRWIVGKVFSNINFEFFYVHVDIFHVGASYISINIIYDFYV